MSELGFERQVAEHTVDEVERERVPLVGYGPQEFARNLVIAYERLCSGNDEVVDEDVSRMARHIGCRVMVHPVEPFEGVVETLAWLKPRFRLLVLTKGDQEVQESKLVRSGLSSLFEAVHVVREKDSQVLIDLVAQYGLDSERTWAVGNSPRSDVNPAVEAGIRAVFIPHTNTWDLEQAITRSDRVIELASFRGLMDLFRDDEDEVR